MLLKKIRFPETKTFSNRGLSGVHRMYMGKWISGIVYLLTGGLFLVGYVYDYRTINDQVTIISGRS